MFAFHGTRNPRAHREGIELRSCERVVIRFVCHYYNTCLHVVVNAHERTIGMLCSPALVLGIIIA